MDRSQALWVPFPTRQVRYQPVRLSRRASHWVASINGEARPYGIANKTEICSPLLIAIYLASPNTLDARTIETGHLRDSRSRVAADNPVCSVLGAAPRTFMIPLEYLVVSAMMHQMKRLGSTGGFDDPEGLRPGLGWAVDSNADRKDTTVGGGQVVPLPVLVEIGTGTCSARSTDRPVLLGTGCPIPRIEPATFRV
jgi:hypothetical protein